MVCIHCGHDVKYKERGDSRCPHCGHHFAFEPKRGDKLTDRAFEEAIKRVSANGTIRWGVEHLYYEVARRLRRNEWNWGSCITLCVASVVLTWIWRTPVFLLGIAAATGVWWWMRKYGRSRIVRLRTVDFDNMWGRWQRAHGQPKSVIVRPTVPPKPRPKESDLSDYSFDRAVICDRARTVDLLLANNFHFENNCAVLSIDGYPPQPFETVRSMLKRNPRVQVYALHDCTPDGCTLAWRLTNDSGWFKEQGTVVDVGLRPHHAGPFVGTYLEPADPLPTVGQGLSAREVEWLQKYSLELAAVRPEQLLRRLFRAINVRRAEDTLRDKEDDPDVPRRRRTAGDGGSTTSGDSSYSEDRDSFGSDAADADESGDSFG